MKPRIPNEVYGLWDFPTFSTVQQLSYSNAKGMLASAIHKAKLNLPFSFIVSKQ
jgi:hypothetical protein